MFKKEVIIPLLLFSLSIAVSPFFMSSSAFAVIKMPSKIIFPLNQAYYEADQLTYPMDAATFADSNRTYVPVRYLGYALGLHDTEIIWNEGAQEVVLNGPIAHIVMHMGSTEIVMELQPFEGCSSI